MKRLILVCARYFLLLLLVNTSFSDFLSSESFSNSNCSGTYYTKSASTGDLGYGNCLQGTNGFIKFSCINSTAMIQNTYSTKDCSGLPIESQMVTNEFGCKVYASIPNQSTRTTCESGSFAPAPMSYVTYAYRDTRYSRKTSCVDVTTTLPNPSSVSEWKLGSCLVPGGYSEVYSCEGKSIITRARFNNQLCSGIIDDETDITVGCSNTSTQALLVVCTNFPSPLPSPLPSVTPSITSIPTITTSPSAATGDGNDFILVPRTSYNAAIAVPSCLLIIFCSILVVFLHKQRFITIPLFQRCCKNRQVKTFTITTKQTPNKDLPIDWGILITHVQTQSPISKQSPHVYKNSTLTLSPASRT